MKLENYHGAEDGDDVDYQGVLFDLSPTQAVVEPFDTSGIVPLGRGEEGGNVSTAHVDIGYTPSGGLPRQDS